MKSGEESIDILKGIALRVLQAELTKVLDDLKAMEGFEIST